MITSSYVISQVVASPTSPSPSLLWEDLESTALDPGRTLYAWTNIVKTSFRLVIDEIDFDEISFVEEWTHIRSVHRTLGSVVLASWYLYERSDSFVHSQDS